MEENYLDLLNPAQREAVEYLDGPSLVIAGAGSGKTRVLTYKIVHLLKNGHNPARLMALTFTNKAAKEMRERIESLVGSETANRLWMGTFHSIFSRILRIHADRLGFPSNFTIYDTSDSKSLVKSIIKEMQLDDDDKLYRPGTILGPISNA
ncbi:MAG: UvrD-helicase domain-containing protein, partial [Bacteroidales bacterium]|nr:UvrD-helicase domain-containing protein [Bacteroidales bacterium]